jgi:predicted DNA-binding transcriptional regulator AlpA
MRTRTRTDFASVLADLPDLVNRRQLCELFQIERHTLNDWMRRRKFPAPVIRTEATHRWLKAHVLHWLQKFGAKSAPQRGGVA